MKPTKIQRCKGCGGHDTIYKTFFESKEWQAWELEVSIRFHKQYKKKVKQYKGVWDVDESRELGIMSRGHFDDFIAFVRTR